MPRIIDKIAQLPPGASFFSLEFFPPKTQAGTANLLPRLQRLAAFRPLFVTVTWGAGGSTATKSLDLAEICASTLGLDVCLHLTCTNSSQAVVDEALTRCQELGIRNILALRGDEPRPKEYADPVLDAANGSVRRSGGQPGEGFAGVVSPEGASAAQEVQFNWAEDLVRYIRQKYGDWFCIGVAGYPEGWTASPYDPDRSVDRDLPYLVQKVQAGADFIMTQLFFDTDAYLDYARRLQAEPALKDLPLVPGLMPVQSWGILARTTKLTGAHVPSDILERFEKVKTDDDGVKQVGVEVLSDMVSRIRKEVDPRRPPQGYHFYTLNLEKAVAQILHRCDLIPPSVADDAFVAIDDELAPNGHSDDGSHKQLAKDRRRLSSATTQNRVIVTRPPDADGEQARYQEAEKDAAQPRDQATHAKAMAALAIAEGDGSLGREATWDDYPNGRWGDARSPAYGSIDGYGPSLHVSNAEAIALWGRPVSRADITNVFHRYLQGQSSAVPWSEEALSPETKLVEAPLLAMNDKGWWSVASQPAVDGQRSSDPVVGWGPQSGGWVWQKPFVEFFLPRADWEALRPRLDAFREEQDEAEGVVYFAGDAFGSFESCDVDSVNPVTWGSFKGKEIITPTIIEAESFRAWQDEAFGIWREWQRVYPPGSPSSRLIESVWRDVVLVNVIGHCYRDGGTLWDLLLDRLA